MAYKPYDFTQNNQNKLPEYETRDSANANFERFSPESYNLWVDNPPELWEQEWDKPRSDKTIRKDEDDLGRQSDTLGLNAPINLRWRIWLRQFPWIVQFIVTILVTLATIAIVASLIWLVYVVMSSTWFQ